jgi:AraC-like DNA-binding protein
MEEKKIQLEKQLLHIKEVCQNHEDMDKTECCILSNFSGAIFTSLTLIIELLEQFLSFNENRKKELEIIYKHARRLMELSDPLQQIIQNPSHLEKDMEKTGKQGKANIQGSTISNQFIRDLRRVLEKHFSDPDFTVKDLAKQLHMSEPTLCRKIRAAADETPCEFIRSYRLQRAAQLLKKHIGSVTDVAFNVGFNSRTYFTKCFKDKFSRSPSTYMVSNTREY